MGRSAQYEDDVQSWQSYEGGWPSHEALWQSHEALCALGLGERGVYLLDAVPVLEVLWADGCAREEEVCHLAAFVRQRRADVNAAVGYELLEEADVERFVERFTWMRPPRALLRRLRTLFDDTMGPADCASRRNEARRREAIVQACLRVAIADSDRPFAGLQTLRAVEQDCLRRILDSLAHRAPQLSDDAAADEDRPRLAAARG